MVLPTNLTTAPVEFSATGLYETIAPALIFVIGMVIYAVFIFKFYRFIASRDIFELNLQKYNTSKLPALRATVGFLLYMLEYLLIFPLFLAFWFGTFTILIAALSEKSDIQTILLVSISIIAAVRITTYYDEDLSKDLAKMLPFALLGIFLIDVSYFDLPHLIDILKQMPTSMANIAYYLILVVAVEYVLRIGHGLVKLVKGD